jgi:hypothetical protein
MIDRHDYTLQIVALHPWVLCDYDSVYRKLLIMLILCGCFLLLEWQMDGFYHAITLQIFALHAWALCYYDSVYRKLLIMLILCHYFLLLEWQMDGFYHAINWDSVYGFLTLFSFALTATICLLSIYWLNVLLCDVWWMLSVMLYMIGDGCDLPRVVL